MDGEGMKLERLRELAEDADKLRTPLVSPVMEKLAMELGETVAEIRRLREVERMANELAEHEADKMMAAEGQIAKYAEIVAGLRVTIAELKRELSKE